MSKEFVTGKRYQELRGSGAGGVSANNDYAIKQRMESNAILNSAKYGSKDFVIEDDIIAKYTSSSSPTITLNINELLTQK